MSAQDIKVIANDLRSDVLEMVYEAGAGHIAGPLSIAEVFATLYCGEVVTEGQDKIILSCGHYVPIQYAALAKVGLLPRNELQGLMKVGSRLPGHPERGVTPGIEVSTGPLGQGVSVAVGMALGLKIQQKEGRVYCVLSDGEIQEGQVWEAFNLAVRRQLSNLVFILDRNRIQIGHYVAEIVDYGNLEGRFEAFGLHTLTINGHEPEEIQRALRMAREAHWAPTMIVANTTAGKGVSFMENKPEWHDRAISKADLELALKELRGESYV